MTEEEHNKTTSQSNVLVAVDDNDGEERRLWANMNRFFCCYSYKCCMHTF